MSIKRNKLLSIVLAVMMVLSVFAIGAQDTYAATKAASDYRLPDVINVTAEPVSYDCVALRFYLNDVQWIADPNDPVVRLLDIYVDGNYIVPISEEWDTLKEYYLLVDVPHGDKEHEIWINPRIVVPKADGTYEDYFDENKLASVQAKPLVLGKSSLGVTKLGANKVRITVKKGEKDNYTDVYSDVQVKNGSSWKTIKEKVGGKTNVSAFVYEVKGAASKSYRVISYFKDAKGKYVKGKTSSAFKAKENVHKTGMTLGAAIDDQYGTANFVADKFYYSNGKLKVKGWVGNSRIFTLKNMKITVTVRYQGKQIAKQAFTAGNLGSFKTKAVTYTFSKAKTGCDLKHGDISFTIAKKPTWDM